MFEIWVFFSNEIMSNVIFSKADIHVVYAHVHLVLFGVNSNFPFRMTSRFFFSSREIKDRIEHPIINLTYQSINLSKRILLLL